MAEKLRSLGRSAVEAARERRRQARVRRADERRALRKPRFSPKDAEREIAISREISLRGPASG